MAKRKCKCKICTNELTTDIAFKVTNEKGVNSYYCSEDEYNQMMKEKTSKDKCLATITEIFGVKMLPPVMVKKVNELRPFYDYVVIEKTFKEYKDKVKWALESKDFNNEFSKAKYIISIIANNIEQVNKKHMKDIREMERLFVKDEKIVIEDLDITRTKTNDTSDISAFLD